MIEPSQHLKAVGSGHEQIQDQHVRMLLFDEFQGFRAIAGRAHHLEIAVCG